jgi:hypothetical protein
MRTRWIACMLIASVGGTQAWATTMVAAWQAQTVQAASPQTPAAGAPAVAPGTIQVPAGTKIPLSLLNQVMSLSSKPGAAIRAVVAFPVTVGNQLAIPAGTFVDGQLVSARPAGSRPPKGSTGPALQIHFTRLVYANGYTVQLDAQHASLTMPAAASGVEVAAVEDEPLLPVTRGPRDHGPGDGTAYLEGQFPIEPTPPAPTLPQHPGPNPVVITLAAVGGFAVLLIGALLLARHSVNHTDAVLYDAGWQFSMSLTTPLTLDTTQVMDAAKMAVPAPSQ